MKELYGGTIRFRPNHRRGTWRWDLWGDAAAEALKLMLPFLHLKGEEAVIAVSFQARRIQFGDPNRYREDMMVRHRNRDNDDLMAIKQMKRSEAC